MRIRFTCLLATLLVFLGAAGPCYAYDTDEHSAQIEYVLFGNRDYKNTHPRHEDKVQALENAVFLCVDQFNGSGQDELGFLIDRGIPDLPKSISEIDFTGNYAHRGPTHSGWNAGHATKCNWPVRERILTSTVKFELFPSNDTVLTWFPWLEEKIFGEEVESRAHSREQCEAFSMLLYYVHVLGDHIHAGDDDRNAKDGSLTFKQKLTGLAYIDALTRPNDRDNPGIIPDLRSSLATLFAVQEQSRTYKSLMNKLDEYEAVSDELVNSRGGVDTEGEFAQYNKCANDLLDTLAEYVPKLLEKEEFFKNSFS